MKHRHLILDLAWLAMLAATAVTWALGSSGWVTRAQLAGMAVVFALAWLKGLGVILEFMELRHAPALWRRALIAALTLVVLLILLAYGLSLR
ncbi:MAG TPA: cytochrome C oxidase subunit IV family protein [Aquabacterium sp.]|nr:cytochrome C oxidase subunit IV family protein [Aquabacterium sp.]